MTFCKEVVGRPVCELTGQTIKQISYGFMFMAEYCIWIWIVRRVCVWEREWSECVFPLISPHKSQQDEGWRCRTAATELSAEAWMIKLTVGEKGGENNFLLYWALKYVSVCSYGIYTEEVRGEGHTTKFKSELISAQIFIQVFFLVFVEMI